MPLQDNRRHHLSRIAAVLAALLLGSLARAQMPEVEVALAGPPAGGLVFDSEEIAVGVVLDRPLVRRWRDRPQSIHVLRIDPRMPGLRLAFAGEPLQRTSLRGERSGAVAAVNGGFFDRAGRAQGALRVDGQEIGSPSRERTSALVTRTGTIAIVTDPAGRFEEWPQALSAGPRLLAAGKMPDTSASWSPDRHPRTAAALRSDGILLLITVDGRTPEAAGLTLQELAGLCLELGAQEALNLDGGGSTTLWARGAREGGIVNFPCDNRRFDREGERAVGNAILVLARDIVLVETEAADLAPPASWTRREGVAGALGGDLAESIEAGANATFAATIDLPGRYAIESWAADHAPVRWTGPGIDAVLPAGPGWQRIGEITVAIPGRAAVTATAGTPGLLVVDAVRFVQLEDL